MDTLAERSSRGRRVLLLGVGINVALAAVKLLAGWLGHSAALVADGLESSMDVISGTMIWVAMCFAERPPDDKHPYGHGKMESLAAAGAAGMLIIAGLSLAAGSVHQIINRSHMRESPAFATIVVLVMVVLVKELWFRLVNSNSHELGSKAVEADAWHHRSDALTSAAAGIGISASLIGGPKWAVADNWAAIFSCAFIAYNGGRMLFGALGDLLDQQAPPEIIERISAAAREVSGVRNVEKCRVRRSGLSLIADIHVRVDGSVTVSDGHLIAHRVKDRLLAGGHLLSDVTVHIEPA